MPEKLNDWNLMDNRKIQITITILSALILLLVVISLGDVFIEQWRAITGQ